MMDLLYSLFTFVGFVVCAALVLVAILMAAGMLRIEKRSADDIDEDDTKWP